jgi:hypothetical protein
MVAWELIGRSDQVQVDHSAPGKLAAGVHQEGTAALQVAMRLAPEDLAAEEESQAEAPV